MSAARAGHHSFRATLVTAVLAVAASILAAQAQQPVTRSESARIEGRVVDDASSQPLRDAIVTLTATGTNQSIEQLRVLTLDDGRFAFTALPAGTFEVTVVRSGYVPISSPWENPPTVARLTLAANEASSRTEIRLRQPALIEGTVRDERGDPVAGIRVGFWRVGVPNEAPNVRTNDRGEYSAAVEAGDYFVAVEMKTATKSVASVLGECVMFVPWPREPPRVRAIAEPDGHFALALNYGSGTGPIPPVPGFAYATTFYPNAIDREDATRVTVKSGERRQGINIQLPLLPVTRISGRLLGPDGRGVGNGLLALRHAGRNLPLGGTTNATSAATPDDLAAWSETDADGTFAFLNIPAGEYTIEARRNFSHCDVGRLDDEDWRASVPVSVGAVSISNLSITMQAHARVTRPLVGQFRGAAGAEDQPVRTGAAAATLTGIVRDDLSRPVSRAIVELTGSGLALGRLTLTDDAGRFTVTGLPAGSFALLATKAGYATAVAGRKDDGPSGVPVPLQAGERRSVTIELPRAATVTGTVRNMRGEPVEGAQVILQRWLWDEGRRTMTDGSAYVRTDRDGQYRIFGVAAGEYVVVAHPITVATREMRMSTAPDGRPLAVPSVFFPGTTDASRADVVSLAHGDERSGIDFVLGEVDTFRIDGQVVTAGYGFPKASFPSIQVMRASDDQVNPFVGDMDYATQTGNFTFDYVPVGHHVLVAHWDEQGLWGAADVVGAAGQTVNASVQMVKAGV